MTKAQIDSASLYDVSLALGRADARASYEWEWKQSLTVTAALISGRQTTIAASPTTVGQSSGAFGRITDGLSLIIAETDMAPETYLLAMTRTKRWARRNIALLRSSIRDITSNTQGESNAARWLDAHLEGEWVNHSIRYRGLFDACFSGIVAEVLDVPTKDVTCALSSSGDARLVARLARERPNNEQFQTIRDAYLISTLLRGRYYEHRAELTNRQVLSHPIRAAVRKRVPKSNIMAVDVSNTEVFLSNIVLAGAYSERSHEARAEQWARGVMSLRTACTQFNLEPKPDEVAIEVAIDAAKKAQIAPGYKKIKRIIDWTLDLGLAGFGLQFGGFGGAAAGLVVSRVIGESAASERTAKAFTSRRGYLRRLATLGPGRIDSASE